MARQLSPLIFLFACIPGTGMADVDNDVHEQLAQSYAELVHANYADARAGAQHLEETVSSFVSAPDAAGLKACRQAWTMARRPYILTEAFRFYNGPIDDSNGPEGLINSWPVDETWLESGTSERPGLIEDAETFPEITPGILTTINQVDGEKNVAAGWHAIEFLLWGRDESAEGPGDRPVSDFVSEPFASRRCEALRASCLLLVNCLNELETDWAPASTDENYRNFFLKSNPESATRRILTGLYYLSGHELAGERINVALETRSQEDEQSCFSDTTLQDFRWGVKGLRQVWEGRYESVFEADGDVSGFGLVDFAKAADPEMAARTQQSLERLEDLINIVPHPFDQAILGDDASTGRRALLELMEALERFATQVNNLAGTMNYDLTTLGSANAG